MDSVSAITVKELIDDRIGRRRVMDACGVKTQAITNWIGNDPPRIPAHHYPAFRKLCTEAGIPVPEHLFFSRAAAA